MRLWTVVASLGLDLAAGLVACSPAPRPWSSPDATTYARLRGQLEEQRQARATSPWAAGIHVAMREPRSGRTVEGRGGIAVAPGRAVRMILLAGAGSTMLDAWVSTERYRFAIPALDRVLTGSGIETEVADLPVGFLRWWFLAPLEGALFAASAERDERDGHDEVWLLRAGDAVVELRTAPCEPGQGLQATRRARGRADRVLECRHAAGPSAGDFAEYDDSVSGLHVRIDVESVATDSSRSAGVPRSRRSGRCSVSDVALIALGAVSGLGQGAAAFDAGTVGRPARVAIASDDELARAGLARPHAARAPVPVDVSDRATWLLGKALADCAADLDRVRPAWRAERVGLFLGTSSGGMRQAEKAFERIAAGQTFADPESATYFGPIARAVRDSGLSLDPVLLVLGACASSVLAIGLATRSLTRGDCDVALAGGFDDVTVFVAAGFEALRATTATPPPRPFRTGRDGMSLGEGAGLVALVRDVREARARAFVTGFGAASDAVHLTAPDREGKAVARAIDAALAEAGRPRIDLGEPPRHRDALQRSRRGSGPVRRAGRARPHRGPLQGPDWPHARGRGGARDARVRRCPGERHPARVGRRG